MKLSIYETKIIETPFVNNKKVIFCNKNFNDVKHMIINDNLFKIICVEFNEFGELINKKLFFGEEIEIKIKQYLEQNYFVMYGTKLVEKKEIVHIIHNELVEIDEVKIIKLSGLDSYIKKSDFLSNSKFTICEDLAQIKTSDDLMFSDSLWIYKSTSAKLIYNDTILIDCFIEISNDKIICGKITSNTRFILDDDFVNDHIVDDIIDVHEGMIEVSVTHENTKIKENKSRLEQMVKDFLHKKIHKIGESFIVNGFNINILKIKNNYSCKNVAFNHYNPNIYITTFSIFLYDDILRLDSNHKVIFEIIKSDIKEITVKEVLNTIAKNLNNTELYSIHENYEAIYINSRGIQNKIIYKLINVTNDSVVLYDKSTNPNNILQIGEKIGIESLKLVKTHTDNIIVIDDPNKYIVKSISFEIEKNKNVFSMEKEEKSIEKIKLIDYLISLNQCVLSTDYIIKYNLYNLTITNFRLDTDKEIKQTKVYLGKITDTTEIIFEESSVTLIDESKSTEFTLETIKKMPELLKKMGMGGIEKYLTKIIKEVLISRTNLFPKKIHELMKPAKGVILYGPPGTGKTTLAKNIATILGCDNEHVNKITATEILSMWLGKSEENARALFEPAIAEYKSKGDKSSLHILIIDEIDAIIGKRSGHENSTVRNSIVNQLLGLMDGLVKCDNIIVIGITNCLELIDKAMLRPGRFGCHVEIGLPDYEQRKDIISLYHTKIRSVNVIDDIDIDNISNQTKNFSCADIENIFTLCINNYYQKKMMKFNFVSDGDNINNTEEDKLTKDEFQLILNSCIRQVNNSIDFEDYHRVSKKIKL